MIEVRELGKSFGELRAVDGLSLQVRRGEAFGLLGPNGAGKTTTLLMMVGVLAPDAGEVLLDGQSDPTRAEVRRRVGIAPQELAVYDELTGEENLTFFGRLYGLAGRRLAERVDWGLDFAGLTERRRDRAGGYSGGMKRRLNLACALVHEPDVLFCDEPTVGVDPQSRHHVLSAIERLAREGTTLVYTTHYMEEAQRLCDRVGIVDHGRLLALDTVEALLTAHGGTSVVEAELLAPPPEGVDLPGTLEGTHLRLESARPFEAVAALGRSGVDLSELRVQRPDLEQVFLHLTGRRLRD
jgi:ABC-2 type transport system ATP-binding protein